MARVNALLAPSSPAVATNGHAASRLFSAGSRGSDSNDGLSHTAPSRGDGQEFHGRRDFSNGQDPSQAVGTAGEAVGGQRSMLLWFEPFETPDMSPDDVLRFTTTAASSIARSAGLAVRPEDVRSEGGYAAVLCEATGGWPSAEVCNEDAMAWDVGSESPRGGHYLATSMVAYKG